MTSQGSSAAPAAGKEEGTASAEGASCAPPLGIHSLSFCSQLASTECVLIGVFFGIGMLTAQFTVAAIGVQLEAKGEHALAAAMRRALEQHSEAD